MSYNLLNLPQQVDILSPVGEARNAYVYAANGTKLQVVKKYNSNYNSSPIIGSAVNTSNLDVTKTTDYVGNLIFENDVLDRILVDGGYVKDGVYYFYETDHLGDNRTVVNQSGTVTERNDYYPYGMQMAHNELTNSASATDNKYKYNGKELDVMHGLNLYDYAARMQDPTLGRFTTVDPLAEKYYSISPYAYCANNPLRFVDSNGEEPTEAEAAAMSAHVYGCYKDDILIGNWKVSNKNFNIEKTNSYNGLKSQVYERTVDGKAEYSYVTAGTEDKIDWVQNAEQLGGNSSQYKESADNAKKISTKLGDSELIFVGHSLGGGEAALNAMVTDRKAITFNAAGVSNETKAANGVSLSKGESNISAIIMVTDPLNALQKALDLPTANGNIKYLKPTDWGSVFNGHSMDNVLKNYGINISNYKTKN